MPLSPTQKVQRYRRRKRAGLEVWRVEVDPIAVTDWLMDTGYLQVWDATDDRAVATAALSRAIAVYSRP